MNCNKKLLQKLCFSLISLILISELLISCSGRKKYFPENTFKGKKIAVAPFVLNKDFPIDSIEAAEIFSNELVRVGDITVIRPAEVYNTAVQNNIALETIDKNSIKRIIQLGKILGVDAIIVVKVTDYNPYFPHKIIALATQMISTEVHKKSSENIAEMIAAGKPYPINKTNVSSVIGSIEKIFDSDDVKMREDLKRYAQYFSANDGVYAGEDVFLKLTPKYLQFASNRLICELLSLGLKFNNENSENVNK